MTPLDKNQLIKIAKAAFYVSLSAGLDYLISQTGDTQFGTLTPIINVALVGLKQLMTEPGKGK